MKKFILLLNAIAVPMIFLLVPFALEIKIRIPMIVANWAQLALAGITIAYLALLYLAIAYYSCSFFFYLWKDHK
jgi:hypothetical protein